MARTYKRDARGRFASGGGSSGGGSKGKTLKRGRAQLSEARGKVRTAKGKLAAFDPADQTIKSSLSKRAQRGAVTKAEKRLTTVKRTAVIKGRRMTGTIGKLKAGRGGVARISRAEPLMTGGTLAARSSLARARRKLAENATPAQRGAVTRAKKYAAQSYDKNTQPRKFGRPASVMRKRPPESPLRWQVGGGKAGVATRRAASKPKRQPKGPMSESERNTLSSAKGDLRVMQERLKQARKIKSTAKGPLEKLKAQDKISEFDLGVKKAANRVTLLTSRAVPGRPITGDGRYGERITLRKQKITAAMRGRVMRDPFAAAKAPKSLNLSAGRYKNLYINNANKAAAAARRR